NIVEAGDIDSIINRPRHRYTAALLAANPGMPKDDNFSAFIGRRLQTITGSVPAVGRFPSGCRFRNRCQHASDKCVTTPTVTATPTDHRYLCWYPAQGGQS
ncbi:MAG: oligopeptide/dipeptide ABC transporter ATP-binding protein, partial [Actinomycetota bacterium]